MSDLQSLQNELTLANNNNKGLMAQLDAAKQMVNEQMNTNLQLRTSLNISQQNIQELLAANETHRKQVIALSSKLLELQPIPQPEELTPITE